MHSDWLIVVGHVQNEAAVVLQLVFAFTPEHALDEVSEGSVDDVVDEEVDDEVEVEHDDGDVL